MHLSDNECLLYQTRFGLSDEQRQEMQMHFMLCGECEQKMKHFEKLVSKATIENDNECQQIENELFDYKTDNLDENRKNRLTKHLMECENCRYFFNRLNKFKLEMDLIKTVEPANPSYLNQLKSFLNELREKIGTLISISLAPLEPAPAFLGDDSPEVTGKIRHRGGDILVHLNESGKKTVLLSVDNLELDRRKSDEFGVVRFSDFLPGDYRIQVPGAAICQLVQKK